MDQSAGRRRLRLLGFVMAIALTGTLRAEESTPQQAVSDLMLLAGIPGMQVAVVKGDKVVWQHSFGDAVLEVPGPKTPMRDDTRLMHASVGKIFTTVAVMQLVDEGRIKLDDDIDKYLPWVVRNPHYPGVPITWRMLISHTSSLNEEEDEHTNETMVLGADDTERTLASVAKSVFAPDGKRRLRGQWTNDKPGTTRIYSNDAYVLLSYAVERLIGKPYGEYLEQSVFAPLGLTHTMYRLKGHETEPFAVPYASIRQAGGRHQFEPAKKFWYHKDPGGSVLSHQASCVDFASGVYHTTASDLTRLMRMLMNGGAVDGVRVLSVDSVKAMMTPNGLYNHEGWRQGLGLYGPRDLNGRWVWGHDGVDRGVSAAFFFDPKTQIGAVAIGNAQYPDWTLTAALVDIDLHLIDWFQ